MRHYFQAERLKYRHSAVEWMPVFMPLFSVLLAAVLTWEYFAVDSYNWWYMTLFPGFTAILCGLIGTKDRKMQNRAILTLPVDMGKVWDGKVLCGLLGLGMAMLVLVLGTVGLSVVLERGFGVVFFIRPVFWEQAWAALLLWVAFLWQVPFCLLLFQLVGFFPMLLLHMGSYIILAASMSLKPYFVLFPGALASRMMCVVLKILPNGLPAEPGQMTFVPELLDQKSIPLGLFAAIFWFILFWWLGRMLFERQAKRG